MTKKNHRIRLLGDPMLRRKARRLAKPTAALRETIEAMWETMYDKNGIGLAAPQVGISQRVIVVDTRDPDQKFALVNPEIIWSGGNETALSEGCLSMPGVEAEVVRPSHIKIRGLSPEGKRVDIECRDLLAKVFQHEIDHLNGILFIDHLSDADFDQLLPELLKFDPNIESEILHPAHSS